MCTRLIEMRLIKIKVFRDQISLISTTSTSYVIDSYYKPIEIIVFPDSSKSMIHSM